MKRSIRAKKAVAGRLAGEAKPEKRGWPAALAWAGVSVGSVIILSAVVNPLFGRFVHWDWMAGLAPALFVLLTLALRRRWV